MLINDLKKRKIKSMKSGENLVKSILNVVISESCSIAKNDGNRDCPSDAEVIKVIEKQINNNKDMLNIPQVQAIKEKVEGMMFENEFLSSFLPSKLSEEELENEIKNIIQSLPTEKRNIKEIMSRLKEDFSGKFDGKMASSLCAICLKS